MRSEPDDVSEDAIRRILLAEWGIEPARLDYVPEGGGAYHWRAAEQGGRCWFVTCDDLGTKPWLGSGGETVFHGLSAAYETARWLGDPAGAGLAFVAPPQPSRSSRVTARLSERYALSIVPFLDGTPGRWGEALSPPDREELAGMLAALHACRLPSGETAGLRRPRPPRPPADLPARGDLAEALGDLDRPWTGGRYGEEARAALGSGGGLVEAWLADFDTLSADLAGETGEPVLTHGEPHPGNLVRTGEGFVLVDWDTVGLERPERDLWMLDDEDGSAWRRYESLAGRPLDRRASRLYRLRWALSDLALFARGLRGPHPDNRDTRRSLAGMRMILAGEEPAPYGRAG